MEAVGKENFPDGAPAEPRTAEASSLLPAAGVPHSAGFQLMHGPGTQHGVRPRRSAALPKRYQEPPADETPARRRTTLHAPDGGLRSGALADARGAAEASEPSKRPRGRGRVLVDVNGCLAPQRLSEPDNEYEREVTLLAALHAVGVLPGSIAEQRDKQIGQAYVVVGQLLPCVAAWCLSGQSNSQVGAEDSGRSEHALERLGCVELQALTNMKVCLQAG